MTQANEIKQAIYEALNIPPSLSEAIISVPVDQPTRVWYEPGKVREIVDVLKERLYSLQVPTYIEFQTRDPHNGTVFTVRGFVNEENIKALPRMIVNARSDIRIYSIHNQICVDPEATK